MSWWNPRAFSRVQFPLNLFLPFPVRFRGSIAVCSSDLHFLAREFPCIFPMHYIPLRSRVNCLLSLVSIWSSQSCQKIFEGIRTIGTIEAICGFHIIASIVSKTDTARFGPGETTSFWRESCKTKRKVPKVIYWLRYCFLSKIICIRKYGFIRKFCRLLYYTPVQELRLHSLVFVVLFWNAFFGTQCKKSIEFWNNRCILGYVWIAPIVRVMREWFPFNRLQIFTIASIVRIELEAIQAIVIAPIVRVVSVVSVVFPFVPCFLPFVIRSSVRSPCVPPAFLLYLSCVLSAVTVPAFPAVFMLNSPCVPPEICTKHSPFSFASWIP